MFPLDTIGGFVTTGLGNDAGEEFVVELLLIMLPRTLNPGAAFVGYAIIDG